MGKTSKYEGGSKEISFRLPADKFDEAKKGIESYLRRFERGYEATLTNFIESVSKSNLEPYRIPTEEEWAEMEAIAKPLIDEIKVIDPEFFDNMKKQVDLTPPEWVKEHKQVIKKTIDNAYELKGSPETSKTGFTKLGKGQQMRSEKKPIPSGYELYPCGCVMTNGVFNRNENCEIKKEDHGKQ